MVHKTTSPHGLYLCHIRIKKTMLQLNNHEDIGQGQRSLCATHPLMLVIIHAKYGKNSFRTVCAVKRTQQDVPYFSSFITKSWLNDLEDKSQAQRSLHLTLPLIICAKLGKLSSRTVHAVEQTWQDVPYFSSFIAKSKQNDLKDIGQGQRSLCATLSLMPVIFCAQYRKNPSRTVDAVDKKKMITSMRGCVDRSKVKVTWVIWIFAVGTGVF